ncbi:hypothetical protein AB5N19_11289 [Seiridium cardinale]
MSFTILSRTRQSRKHIKKAFQRAQKIEVAVADSAALQELYAQKVMVQPWKIRSGPFVIRIEPAPFSVVRSFPLSG